MADDTEDKGKDRGYGSLAFMRDLMEMSEACRRMCGFAEEKENGVLMRATTDLMYQLALVASVAEAMRMHPDRPGKDPEGLRREIEELLEMLRGGLE